MKKSWLVFAVFFLGGCAGTKATIGEFQGMSSDERTKYVCENHAEVKKFAYMTDSALVIIKRGEASIEEHGDREQKSCSSSYSSDGSFSASFCVTQSTSGALRTHRENHKKYSRLLAEKMAECEEDVQDLGVEEAYGYYQKVEGGHHWDTMRKMFIE